MIKQPPLISLVSADGEQKWNQEALATTVQMPRLALWNYEAPAVVLGCLQKQTVTHHRSLPMIKRMAGGGAVLVGPWMLSLSVALPALHPLATGGLIESYRWLGELIAGVLREFGVDAQALAPSELPPKDEQLRWACFGSLSPWEVVAGGRKIAGLAQRRSRNGLLLVGGILVGDVDWPLLCTVMERDDSEASRLSETNTSCAAELRYPVSMPSLASSLENAISRRLFPAASQQAALRQERNDLLAQAPWGGCATSH